MKTRSNMPLFVLECDNVKTLSNSQIDLLRCGDWLVKKDASGEHAYKVTFKSDTGMCLTYHDASVIETQSYDLIDGVWTYNSEDKTELPVNEGDLVVDDLEVKGDAKLFENIVDKDGHKRFIEGDITIDTIEGVSQTYGKWSLSGSHLLIVIAGNIANTTALSGSRLALLNIPQWIKDKIVPLVNTYVIIETKPLTSSTYTTQNIQVVLNKPNTTTLEVRIGSLTLTADRMFRFNFDLLIDNE